MSDKTNDEELATLREESVIKDSMILEYKQALTEAHYKIAMLNGQLKLANLNVKDSTD